MEEEKDIMGPELVGVRNCGYRYQRMSFVRLVDTYSKVELES
jgi:hypothetical protein